MLEFLVRNGYLVLFLWVFGEQVGLPIPSVPLLLGAGALVGSGYLNLFGVLALSLLACTSSDLIWYLIGARGGTRVLNWLCRISLEPDSCVRQTEESFAKNGARTLIVAKFIPGLSTAAPPMAGMFQMRLWRFLLFDTIGSALWVSTFVGLGYLFSDQLERVLGYASSLGLAALVLMLIGLAAYIGFKYLQRRKFIRQLRIARITPEQLMEKMQAGEDLTVVDLRHPIDFNQHHETIPGALKLSPGEIRDRHSEIPNDRDLILYCT